MAHTYPNGFIPLGDAFMRALSALEDCTPLAHLIDEAITDDERDGRINKYDAVVRRVERLMRNAIADGTCRRLSRRGTGRLNNSQIGRSDGRKHLAFPVSTTCRTTSQILGWIPIPVRSFGDRTVSRSNIGSAFRLGRRTRSKSFERKNPSIG